MFTWVGNQFNTVLSTYVLGVVSSLMTAIAPIALICMTIWVTLYGWAVLRNEVSETLPVFMWKVFKIGLVLAFALQSGFYISNVADSANALATGVALAFRVGSGNGAHSTADSKIPRFGSNRSGGFSISVDGCRSGGRAYFPSSEACFLMSSLSCPVGSVSA